MKFRSALASLSLFLTSFGLVATVAGAETLVEKFLRVVGLSAAPTVRGGLPGDAGAIWVARIDSGSMPLRWTQASAFRSPVFDPQGRAIYAMRQDELVRIDAPESTPVVIRNAPGVDKLVGFDPRNPTALLVLTKSPKTALAALSLNGGSDVSMPLDLENTDLQRLSAQIRAQDRSVGDLRIQVVKTDRQELTGTVEWTDIVAQSGSQPARNLSNCNGALCSQPALAPDLSRVAYVRSTR